MSTEIAFVTGATGLLGSNLVRQLVAEGMHVRALARSAEKAHAQLGGLPNVEIVVGDLAQVDALAPALRGVDALFHTAAHFRDSFKGGDHWPQLHAINVVGTRQLLRAAYDAGVRRMVHTSSIAVLDGPRGATIDETMLRRLPERDPYYRSKVMADDAVYEFLVRQPDFWATLVLPGWMHGPGDAGPTSAGQMVADFLRGQLPGVVPATVSLVDARDVAIAQVAALRRGRRGERYLAAGRHMDMAAVFRALAAVSGIAAPTRPIQIPLLYAIAGASELAARLTRRPALLSWATVRIMMQEHERSRFDPGKSMRELGVAFRPVEDTLRDEIDWLRARGMA